MMFRNRALGVSLAALVAVGVCGCGDQRPKTVAVKGSVVYNNSPVEGAAVMFQRDGARPATGQTDEEGNFTLTTFGENDGAIPGEYVVTITKMESAPEPTGEVGREPPKAAASKPKSLLPVKYSEPKSSDLKETVSAPGPNEFTFELKD